jgi:hypothetical protein
MTAIRAIRIDGDWALAADRLQWILQRRHAGGWRPVSFVSSSKDILARCMREEGVPADAAQRVLASLPDTFAEWAHSHLEAVAVRSGEVPSTCPYPSRKSAPKNASRQPTGPAKPQPKLDPRLVPDPNWPGLYRIRKPDGSLTDMVNLTRARDALRDSS